MTTPPQFSGQLTDVPTEAFFDSPTIVGSLDEDAELSLFNLPTEIAAPDVNPVRFPGPHAPQTSSYTVTHEIGYGGYGVVWNGLQKNLNRRVALKTLKANVASTLHFERLVWLFRQEAITTAYLQHPNVVPVYDLTEDTEGLPILVMKLVEGRQWNRVLAEDFTTLPPLEFLERNLPVLISVSEAVAYAHSRGIIHRDLKPSQIMIGNYSEVLLMDWGLAMAARDVDGQVLCDPGIIVNAESPLIKPMVPSGTPGYMAPEQKTKDASKLGQWTDVYLLGAVLYELLTGLRPHSRPNGEPLTVSYDQDIVRPEIRTPHRDIPAQLSALAMQALAPDPADRVASVSEFTRELKDYLLRAGRRGKSMELVTSVANSVLADEHTYEHLQDCLEKLDRAHAQWPENQMATYLRHQILVTYARTALSNNDLKLARLQAERIDNSHERDAILKEIALEEIEYGSREMRMSQSRLQVSEERNRAEALVRFLLLDLHSELRTLGRANLVHQVAAEALKFYDSIEDSDTSPDTLHNRCLACVQIGDVLSEQGRRDEAEIAYKRALAIAEVLLSATPEDEAQQNLKARCLGHLGRLHYVMGQLDLGQQDYEQSLLLQRHIAQMSPEDPEIRSAIANTTHAMALILWRKQDYESALQKLSESIAYARKAHLAMPSRVECQNDLAIYLASQSNILRDADDIDGASQAGHEALSLRIALSEQFPGNSVRAEEVFWVRAKLSALLLKQGDLEGVISNLKPDLAARRRLYQEDPSNILRTMGLTFHLSLLAEASFLLHRTDEAERLLAECLVHSSRLAQQDDSNSGAVSRYATHLTQMGELQASRGQWSEAGKSAGLALEKARSRYWQSPENHFMLRPLFQALALSARISMRQEKSAESSQLMHEAREVLRHMKGSRDSAEYQSLQARVDFGVDTPANLEGLIHVLKNGRRMDPYLTAWALELSSDGSATAAVQ